MGVLLTITTVVFIILCILLVIVILLQSDKSAGVGIMGGSSQSAFGSSTADVITKVTGVMIALFLLLSMAMAWLESQRTISLERKIRETGRDVEDEADIGARGAATRDSGAADRGDAQVPKETNTLNKKVK
ncbi:MAG: preprotein translocase subunit SecG [Spirochaetes bacterium]|nr:preprotein translocase subunit SecG [Spirochaetota bacterium]